MRDALSEAAEALRTRLVRLREQLDAGEHAEARRGLAALRAECLRAGLASAHLSWMMAAACDGLGEWEAALTHAREALDQDPLALPYRRSYALILEHVREALADEDRTAGDPTTPRLYALLVEAGTVDAASHLAMARWHLHHGEPAGARRILEALVTLSPSHGAAWQLLAESSRAMGDEARAVEAVAVEAGLSSRALRRPASRA